jgi:hypothetical protein
MHERQQPLSSDTLLPSRYLNLYEADRADAAHRLYTVVWGRVILGLIDS